jgi:hypothetical protein
MLFGPEPPASAVALGDLMRSQWAAFAAAGDPGWPPYAPGRRTTRIFDDPPDVTPYPEVASLHIWDQHRFGVLDLSRSPALVNRRPRLKATGRYRGILVPQHQGIRSESADLRAG